MIYYFKEKSIIFTTFKFEIDVFAISSALDLHRQINISLEYKASFI